MYGEVDFECLFAGFKVLVLGVEANVGVIIEVYIIVRVCRQWLACGTDNRHRGMICRRTGTEVDATVLILAKVHVTARHYTVEIIVRVHRLVGAQRLRGGRQVGGRVGLGYDMLLLACLVVWQDDSGRRGLAGDVGLVEFTFASDGRRGGWYLRQALPTPSPL